MSNAWQWWNYICFWLAVANLLFVARIMWVLGRGGRSIRLLKEQPLLEHAASSEWPRVSVIVPARNEERNIEEALQSVLRIDYDNIEVIVVDDRSTDGTAAILDRLAVAHPRLRVVHLLELPAGWLGKNHALHLGAATSTGDLLLLTDADIVFEPTSLQRAVGYLQREELDHLAVGPSTPVPGWLLQSMVATFCYLFSLFAKPWDAKNPRSKAHIGIGAFNLVRAEVWRAVGGMQPIAMRPDDDLKLGKLLKQNGYRQEFVNGRDCISVEWYRTVWELIVGLEKNSFAVVDYRPINTITGTSFLLLTHVWPYVAIFVTWGPTRWLYAASAITLLLAMARAAWEVKIPVNRALGLPFCVALFCFINWRSMVLTLWQGGIRWRDTHYSLAELRANKI